MPDREESAEREWADPAPVPEVERTTRYRIGGGLVGLAVGL